MNQPLDKTKPYAIFFIYMHGSILLNTKIRPNAHKYSVSSIPTTKEYTFTIGDNVSFLQHIPFTPIGLYGLGNMDNPSNYIQYLHTLFSDSYRKPNDTEMTLDEITVNDTEMDSKYMYPDTIANILCNDRNTRRFIARNFYTNEPDIEIKHTQKHLKRQNERICSYSDSTKTNKFINKQFSFNMDENPSERTFGLYCIYSSENPDLWGKTRVFDGFTQLTITFNKLIDQIQLFPEFETTKQFIFMDFTCSNFKPATVEYTMLHNKPELSEKKVEQQIKRLFNEVTIDAVNPRYFRQLRRTINKNHPYTITTKRIRRSRKTKRSSRSNGGKK